MNIKAIETQYKGYRFRSRLEARWAVFFDTLGYKWEYEQEGYDLGDLGWYLPDFWLPEAMFHAEVKPEAPTGRDLERVAYFDDHPPDGSFGLIWLIGAPELWEGFPDMYGGDNDTWHVVGRHSPRLPEEVERAVNAARSVRFEHGEAPRFDRRTSPIGGISIEKGSAVMYLNPRTMEKSEGRNPSDLGSIATMPQEISVQEQGYDMSQETDFDAPENVILQTSNYGMFKFDPLNRQIRQDKLNRLHDSIVAKNLLHLFPIVVTRERVIMDGQHRIKVAEALETPIYYIVSSQMVIEDAARVSGNTDGWTPLDYLDHWCHLGLPDYLELRKFWEGRKWLSLSRAMHLCFKGTAGGTAQTQSLHHDFVDGRYKANNLAQAERVCTMALTFSSWIPFWKAAPFLSALRNLDNNTDYDHSRMMLKMQAQSTKLVKCTTASDYIAVMNTIYNYRASEANKVVLTRIGFTSSKWRD